MSPRHDDAVMDGLALVEAVHAGDLEGGLVLLGNGCPRSIAAFLARVIVDLLEDELSISCLREHYTAG
jgi:hypothetical protein